MKKLSTLFLLVFSVFTQAQTIQSVTIIPAHPTPNDHVKVVLDLAFPSGGCDAQNLQHSSNGSSIMTFAFHCLGPLTFICYTKDTLDLGVLPVGTYTIQNNLMIGNSGISGICSAYVQMDQRDLNFTVTQGTGIAEVAISIPQLLFDASTHTLSLKASDNNDYRVELFDITGKSVFANTVSSGRINYPGTLTKGIYIYSIRVGDKPPFSGKILID